MQASVVQVHLPEEADEDPRITNGYISMFAHQHKLQAQSTWQLKQRRSSTVLANARRSSRGGAASNAASPQAVRATGGNVKQMCEGADTSEQASSNVAELADTSTAPGHESSSMLEAPAQPGADGTQAKLDTAGDALPTGTAGTAAPIVPASQTARGATSMLAPMLDTDGCQLLLIPERPETADAVSPLYAPPPRCSTDISTAGCAERSHAGARASFAVPGSGSSGRLHTELRPPSRCAACAVCHSAHECVHRNDK